MVLAATIEHLERKSALSTSRGSGLRGFSLVTPVAWGLAPRVDVGALPSDDGDRCLQNVCETREVKLGTLIPAHASEAAKWCVLSKKIYRKVLIYIYIYIYIYIFIKLSKSLSVS